MGSVKRPHKNKLVFVGCSLYNYVFSTALQHYSIKFYIQFYLHFVITERYGVFTIPGKISQSNFAQFKSPVKIPSVKVPRSEYFLCSFSSWSPILMLGCAKFIFSLLSPPAAINVNACYIFLLFSSFSFLNTFLWFLFTPNIFMLPKRSKELHSSIIKNIT